MSEMIKCLNVCRSCWLLISSMSQIGDTTFVAIWDDCNLLFEAREMRVGFISNLGGKREAKLENFD